MSLLGSTVLLTGRLTHTVGFPVHIAVDFLQEIKLVFSLQEKR